MSFRFISCLFGNCYAGVGKRDKLWEVREAVDKAFRDWQRHFEEKYTAIGRSDLVEEGIFDFCLNVLRKVGGTLIKKLIYMIGM